LKLIAASVVITGESVACWTDSPTALAGRRPAGRSPSHVIIVYMPVAADCDSVEKSFVADRTATTCSRRRICNGKPSRLIVIVY